MGFIAKTFRLNRIKYIKRNIFFTWTLISLINLGRVLLVFGLDDAACFEIIRKYSIHDYKMIFRIKLLNNWTVEYIWHIPREGLELMCLISLHFDNQESFHHLLLLQEPPKFQPLLSSSWLLLDLRDALYHCLINH